MDICFILDNMAHCGNKMAIVSKGVEYSFQNLLEEYENKRIVLDDAGIQPGDIVCLCADYTPVSIACMLALIERDVILVPISQNSKFANLYVEISESTFFIDICEEQVQITSLNQSITNPMLLDLQREKKAGLILFSSGTTGKPKAILHDLNRLMNKFRRPGKVLRTITFLMFDHEGGFNTLMHALSNGGQIVTLQTRNAEEVCEAIERHKVELLPASPTFLNMMLLSKAYTHYDLSSLKIISYGTEPMPAITLHQLNRAFPNVRLKQTYGLAELGVCASKSENSHSLWMKLGGDGYQFKVVDDVLYIKAESAMIGYLNAPSPFDEEGYFNTKDKVLVKGDFYKILGRETDLLNVGGEKVYPIEIENILLEIEGVLDARVYGMDDPVIGKKIAAELLVKAEDNNREFKKKVRAFCANRLKHYQIPAKIQLTCEGMQSERFKKLRQ